MASDISSVGRRAFASRTYTLAMPIANPEVRHILCEFVCIGLRLKDFLSDSGHDVLSRTLASTS